MSSPTVTKLEFEGYQIIKDTDSDNVVEKDVLSGPCTLHCIDIDNTLNASPTYVKLYDNINPTVGTTDPDEVYMVPASVRRTWPVNPQKSGKSGLPFANGLSFAAVTAGGTAGVTAPTSNATVVLVVTEGVSP